MLVLNRRIGEQIIIGDNIVLTVEDITTNKVRMSFEAPREIPIMRAELIDQDERAPARRSNSANYK